MEWIFDAGTIAVLLIAVSVNARRGFVRAVIMLVGCVAAFAVASLVSAKYTGDLYEDYINDKLYEAVCEKADGFDSAQFINEKLFKEKLDVQATDDEVREAILADGEIADNLTELAVSKKTGVDDKLVGKFLSDESMFKQENADVLLIPADSEDAEQAIRILANEDEQKRTETLYRELVKPFAMKVTRWVAAIVLFLLVSVIVSIVASRFASIINRIPIAGTLNTVLGGCLGVLQGLLVVLVAVFVMKLLVAFAGFDESLVQDTVIFKLFYNFID